MKINQNLFIQKIKKIYIKNPCYLSSIAYWKLENILNNADTYEVIQQNNVYLYAIDRNRLVFYWSEEISEFILTKKEISAFDFIILHQNFFQLIKDDLIGFKISEINPLYYESKLEIPTLHQDYYFDEFQFESDLEYIVAASLINHAYEGHHHTDKEIKSWMDCPAFDQSLWIWIKQKNNNEKVALAISTYQASIKETYLDWIQVLPTHLKLGLGKALVLETINRTFDKSNIIRVTGIADDFYKKCGFTNQEKWYLIQKESN